MFITLTCRTDHTIRCYIYIAVKIPNTLEGFPAIATECSRQHMDVVEKGFKRFVKHMGIVVLKLLSSLDRKQVVDKTGKAIHILLVVSVESVS